MSKKLFLTILFVVSFSVSILAQLPPLIDRELFFGNPEIAGAQISPDGKYISFLKPYNDTRNVCVKDVNEPFDKARVLTGETKRPVGGYFWSQDSKYILFVKDNGGDENFNVYAVNPSEKPAAGATVPAARNLTEGKKVRAQIFNVPETEPDYIYVGLNDRDPAWHDLYKVKISTGEKTLISENKDRLTGLVFDNADKMRLATRSLPNGTTEILSFNGGTSKVVYSCGVFETCSPIRFYKDDKRVYMETSKGERNLSQLVLFDPATGKEEFVEQDPNKRVDFGGTVFSNVSKELIGTTYEDAKTEVYWKDKNFKADYDLLKKRLGDREINFGSSTKDEHLWIVSSFSDTDPGTTWLFNRKTKNLTSLYTAREKLDRKALAKMTPITYKSSDGLEIPAYLTLPNGVPAKNLPLIVFPHGGPWARDSFGYNTFAQFLANRGYAVLSMNFRGSTGYGKKFIDGGNLQWGKLMQDDITWGVKDLVAKGIADSKRVGIMGGSYGGYATLAGVTYTPDLYAAAVAIVAPSNLITLLESVPPYWESIRTTFYERMGNPNTEEGKKLLMESSPLTYADRIKTPLMVVQGANDPRVNKRESDQIVIALRDRNYPVEYLVADDEGHGFQRPVNNMAMIAAAEKFLAKHLGGRFQDTMTDSVAMRLKEITVNPKTVVVTTPGLMSMSVVPSVNVSGKWIMSANAGGMEIPITLDVKQDGTVVSGLMSSPHGDGTLANAKVSGKTVKGIIKAEIQGQPMDLEMEGTVEGDTMTGTLSGGDLPLISFTAKKEK
ncbi:MAG: S9 family peptidase [Pyrinomonadaceae bacterium]